MNLEKLSNKEISWLTNIHTMKNYVKRLSILR